MTRIVLKGYYGFGNLGDDILLMVSARLLKTIFPESFLIVASASNKYQYLMEFCEAIDEVVPLSPEPKADLVFHGGGGTYYDYNHGGVFYWLLNFIIDLIGYDKIRNLIVVYRSIKGWPPNQNAIRVAMGIGVGSFTKSSSKYYHKITELSRFDLIVPREGLSFKALKKLQVNKNVVIGGDLAFLRDYWLPPGLPARKSGRTIGFVLKSWDRDTSYLEIVQQVATVLRREGYSVAIFIFEESQDAVLVRHFNGLEVFSWRPDIVSLSFYLEKLSQASLLVTSRAHGAILGAAFGIPAVLLGIEPKLYQIAGMFPNSASYVPLPLTFENLYRNVIKGLRVTSLQVNSDFEQNRMSCTRAIDDFKIMLQENGYALG